MERGQRKSRVSPERGRQAARHRTASLSCIRQSKLTRVPWAISDLLLLALAQAFKHSLQTEAHSRSRLLLYSPNAKRASNITFQTACLAWWFPPKERSEVWETRPSRRVGCPALPQSSLSAPSGHQNHPRHPLHPHATTVPCTLPRL